jgi:hypothetical protein
MYVADIGSSFRPEGPQQRSPLPYPSPYRVTPTVQQREKLEELRDLLEKFAPPLEVRKILDRASVTLLEGDERFLNEKLQEFRALGTSQDWRPF